MKTIKMQIEIEVPDDIKFVAADKNGEVYAYSVEPDQGATTWDVGPDAHTYRRVHISNWKETLVEVATAESLDENTKGIQMRGGKL